LSPITSEDQGSLELELGVVKLVQEMRRRFRSAKRHLRADMMTYDIVEELPCKAYHILFVPEMKAVTPLFSSN